MTKLGRISYGYFAVSDKYEYFFLQYRDSVIVSQFVLK